MDTRSPIEGRYRFGPFVMDPAERVLTRDGAAVPLTARLFELLLAFVRSPRRLLTKGDLMEFVWPDRVVDEGSLTQAIFSLRKALGDGSEESRYITTVTGRGYSFGATVENIGSASVSNVVKEALATAPTPSLAGASTTSSQTPRRPIALYLGTILAPQVIRLNRERHLVDHGPHSAVQDQNTVLQSVG